MKTNRPGPSKMSASRATGAGEQDELAPATRRTLAGQLKPPEGCQAEQMKIEGFNQKTTTSSRTTTTPTTTKKQKKTPALATTNVSQSEAKLRELSGGVASGRLQQQQQLANSLRSAASEGKVELVRLLLRCGADVNAQDEEVSSGCATASCCCGR